MGWADAIPGWYAEHGRHGLPWRRTRDPWDVLVSEVMLQQTSVGRVLPRWQAFVQRWPTPEACAGATLEEVLREWSGLGYPRRARDLWASARLVAGGGWPGDEVGLRRLPGVGAYTARALLTFALGAECPPPRDVNLGRVAARAGLGVEADRTAPSRLDAELERARPAALMPRDWAYALFDLGSAVCLARRPRCADCPVRTCASRRRLEDGPAVRRRRPQPAYAGSLRELRGAVLRALLEPDPPADLASLQRRLAGLSSAATPGALERAVDGLRSDGLLPDGNPVTAAAGPRRQPRRQQLLP